ncbi:MAG: type II toxin-antitoxin system VapC family toxin [Planctomycetaceae bacterium]|nr:type II toxin-antitoxin system VapC family toxin [Planctomycetaceae bacterium]
MPKRSVFVDSCVLIRYYRDRKQGNTFFEQIKQNYEELYISLIAFTEIMIGSQDNSLEFWNDVLNTITIVPFTQKTVIKTREIAFQLKRKSMMIELADMMIAATAIENDCPLATINQNHFERIDGLKIITPELPRLFIQ